MKLLFCAALALSAALSAFCDSMPGPVIMALQKRAVEAECQRSPTLAKMWYEHCIGAADYGVTDKYTYTGAAFTPTPVVKLNGATLTAGTDFTFSYENNTNAGYGACCITAKKLGLFGTQIVLFYIAPQDFSATAKLTGLSASTNTEPKPTVKIGATTLVLGRDYRLDYTGNVAPATGTATGTVYAVGIGNYTGVSATNFVINAAQ